MARLYGLNGMIRGRQGNNVYSVQNGTQVLKVYQPVVSNPRTSRQQSQRVKFAFAGKMSAATPALALLGMAGSNPRAKRARFVSLLAKAAQITGTAGAYSASLPYGSVLYSEGALARYSAVPTITAEWDGSTINSRVVVNFGSLFAGTDAPAGYGEIGIVALYDAETSMLDEVQAFVRSRTEATTLYFRQGSRRNCYVAAYVAPFVEGTRNSSLNVSNLAGDATSVNLPSQLLSAMSDATWGQSNFLQVIPVLGANTSMAPSNGDDDTRAVVEQALMDTAVTETKRNK